jgi:putative transposase
MVDIPCHQGAGVLAVPWKESDAVDQRMKFIADVLREEESIVALCRRYGVSRQTGYTWIERYLKAGPEALFDRSRAPRSHPNATPQDVVELVLGVRGKHPTWGPKKILASLSRRFPGLHLPATSTAGEILRRAGLTVPRRRSRAGLRPPSHLGSQALPNETWSIDFKGQFRTRDGRYCYPLTLEDGCTRFNLMVQALLQPTGENVRPYLEAAFREFGLPVAMRSDNGAPFAATSFSGLTSLSVWWAQLGIRLDRTTPSSPQQNGRLERFHRTLDEEACTPVRSNLHAQQDAFVAWRTVYNEERPHEAIAMRAPAEIYSPSQRTYPEKIDPPPYDAMVRRTVHGTGEAVFKSWRLPLSTTLAGLEVGLEEKEDGVWEVWFYEHKLATFDVRSGVLSNGRALRQCKSVANRKLPGRALRRQTASVAGPLRGATERGSDAGSDASLSLRSIEPSLPAPDPRTPGCPSEPGSRKER